MIQDLSGSWCIKGTGESTLVMDSPVPLMHNDPDRSWITDLDPDHPNGTQPKYILMCFKMLIDTRLKGTRAMETYSKIATVRTLLALCFNMTAWLSDNSKFSKVQLSGFLLGREKFSCIRKGRQEDRCFLF